MSLPLSGRCILVTRPAAQAGGLAQKIRDAGGDAWLFPAIEIQPVSNDTLTEQIDHLHAYDAAIFISPNAALHGLAAIRARRQFPSDVRVFALGPGTAHALADAGLHGVTQPDGQDTEALLALPQLQNVAGQRIVIFRGVGGRALLADALTTRGATVDYAECYRRACPAADAAPLVQRWSMGEIHAVTITSAETLDNLSALLGTTGQACLRTTPVFVPHEKIAQAARQQGMQQTITTASGDAGLLAGLISWFQTHV